MRRASAKAAAWILALLGLGGMAWRSGETGGEARVGGLAVAQSGTYDPFGVRMIYATKSGGEVWRLSADPTRDPRFDIGDPVTQNSDGSWKMKAASPRMNVFTSSGLKSARTYDRETLLKQGYMQDARDWKDVEITGFVKLNKPSSTAENFAWYARGGRHNDTQPCEGSAYKGDLYYDGRARFAKESWHVKYLYTPYKTVTTPLKGRWVGIKVIFWNTTVNKKPVVKMEQWVDDTGLGKSWTRTYQWTDDGTWGGDSKPCGARDTRVPMLWGGPSATFRWDGATDVDIKWLSVREIIPPN